MVSMKISVVLIAILSQIVFGQRPPNHNFTLCQCTALDECVSKSETTMLAAATTCQQQCTSSLATGGPGALKCLTDKVTTEMANHKTIQTCVEAVVGRTCQATRARRSPGLVGKEGKEKSRGGSSERKNESRAKLSGIAKTELKQFENCFHSCIQTQLGTPNNGSPRSGPPGPRNGPPGPHNGPPGKGHHGGPYGDCQRTLNCTLPPPQVSKANPQVQACFTNTPSTTEQTFCTCLKDVYGQDSCTVAQ